jgi:hypothetical protein
VLLRVSAMAEAHPELAELDLNPLIAHSNGAQIIDARLRLEPARPHRPGSLTAGPAARPAAKYVVESAMPPITPATRLRRFGT